jgi:hypothetical protein
MKRDAQGKFLPSENGKVKAKKKDEKIWTSDLRITQVDYPLREPETSKRKYSLYFYF